MRQARNIAIILALAAVVALVPGGGNAARAIAAVISITFLVLIAFTAYQLYRQNRLAYLGLEDRMRALLLGATGLLVLCIAGADELTETGIGLLVWLLALGASIFAIVRVWMEAQARY